MNTQVNAVEYGPRTAAVAGWLASRAGQHGEPRRVLRNVAETHPGLLETLLWIVAGGLAFHVAYVYDQFGYLVLLYLFALAGLGKVATWRRAFYPGLALGLMIGVPRLEFFWTIFSGGAAALWLVFAAWIGLAAALSRLAVRRLGSKWGWLAVPFIWVGIEYFRSEQYYLRFSWLSPGYIFSEATTQVAFRQLGTYGLSFVLMLVAVVAGLPANVFKRLAILFVGALAMWQWGDAASVSAPAEASRSLKVAGVQMEFPTENEVLLRLTELVRKHSDAQLLVLSEYTFTGPVPERVRDWCRKNARYLVVGGTQPLPGGQFYNTAFVIGPDGNDAFRQVKGVPIQFFKDGLPAPEHRTWLSPWGRIGICICYDLSYTRITDRLIRDGAQALIVPTMDVADWGVAQHKLHARVTPVRAAEYGVPIFRIASSGISQIVDARGEVLAKTGCGEGQMLTGTLNMARRGRLPADRWVAPLCVALTGAFVLTCSLGPAARCWSRLRSLRHERIDNCR